jgi:hypothetical protein
MKTRKYVPLILGLGLCLGTMAYAEEDGTMTLVEEGETPEEIMQMIKLPGSASDVGRENSKRGRDTASDARADGQQFGQDRAELARSDGEDIRAEVRDNARRDARGDNSQGDNPPGGRPE